VEKENLSGNAERPCCITSSSLIGCAVWAFTYRLTRDRERRREMLVTSLLFLAGGFFEPLNIGIYWSPESLSGLNSWLGLDVESFLFNFGFSGIAVTLPYAILSKKIVPVESRQYRKHFPFVLPVPLILFAIATFLAPRLIIWTTFLLFISMTGTVLVFRPDLLRTLAAGAILFSVVYSVYLSIAFLIVPGFISSWNIPALSGIFLFNLPIEEVIFGFLYGAVAATAYKFLFGFGISGTSVSDRAGPGNA